MTTQNTLPLNFLIFVCKMLVGQIYIYHIMWWMGKIVILFTIPVEGVVHKEMRVSIYR